MTLALAGEIKNILRPSDVCFSPPELHVYPHSTTDYASDRRTKHPSARGAEALRTLIRRHATDGSSLVSDEAWRRAARLMSEDARACGVLIEELLVGIKQTWPTLTERQRISRVESAHLLSRFVTLCVQEYYGPLG